jgi:hypothetical protein
MQKVAGSNVVSKTCHPDKRFSWYTQTLQKKLGYNLRIVQDLLILHAVE